MLCCDTISTPDRGYNNPGWAIIADAVRSVNSVNKSNKVILYV